MVLKYKLANFFIFTILMCALGDCAELNFAEEEFELAWQNPAYTQIELAHVDINQRLTSYYESPVPVNFTRKLLWDMETKKAWDPKTYIAYVVKDGRSWGKEILENGDEIFVRSSLQKQWLNESVYEEVFEVVYINQLQQKITFLGTTQLLDDRGNQLEIHNAQPLFHVQHAVGGDENNPVNLWRIVHLTESKNQDLIDRLKSLDDQTRLPGFIEIYINNDMQIPLKHKPKGREG